MTFFSDIKNASSLLLQGEWREFYLRSQVFIGTIDLKVDDPHDLPTEHTNPYSNTGGVELKKVLNSLDITSEDAIVDFGSGKGGALITFSRYPFKKITGVEISPRLAAIADKNLKKLKINNIDMSVCNATEFTDLEVYNYFYFANPFPAKILRTVIENISSSLIINPRDVDIIYFNPMFQEEITRDTCFKKIREFNHCPLGFSQYSNHN